MTGELNEAIAHLTTALAQVAESDDKIIVNHMKDALALLHQYRDGLRAKL
jgi:hypothetical protein|tara:strand:- start:92 stop:241 length:150 start_codon:yes stop_codon:yes gene_type:complete